MTPAWSSVSPAKKRSTLKWESADKHVEPKTHGAHASWDARSSKVDALPNAEVMLAACSSVSPAKKRPTLKWESADEHVVPQTHGAHVSLDARPSKLDALPYAEN